MIALYLFSLTVFIAYIVATIRLLGVPVSISESYYLWPRAAGRCAFPAFCAATALPLMAFWLDISPVAWQFLVFFACAPLLFVAAAGAFREIDLTGRVHFIAAGISALAGLAWIAINSASWVWIVTIVLLAAAGVLARKIKGTDADGRTRSAMLFWFELAVFISVYTAVIIYHISA